MFAVFDDYDSAEQIAAAGVRAGAEFNNASSMPMSSYVIKMKAAARKKTTTRKKR